MYTYSRYCLRLVYWMRSFYRSYSIRLLNCIEKAYLKTHVTFCSLTEKRSSRGRGGFGSSTSLKATSIIDGMSVKDAPSLNGLHLLVAHSAFYLSSLNLSHL